MLDRIQLTKEVEEMCCVKRGVKGVPAPKSKIFQDLHTVADVVHLNKVLAN